MAADLARTPTSGLRVQACGDAHLMNFGGFATPERNVIFDINDLDETLPAPFRVGPEAPGGERRHRRAAPAAAGQRRGPRRHGPGAVYRERMADYASMRAIDVWYDKIDLQRYEDRSADPLVLKEMRKRVAERIEKRSARRRPTSSYPKLVAEGVRGPGSGTSRR